MKERVTKLSSGHKFLRKSIYIYFLCRCYEVKASHEAKTVHKLSTSLFLFQTLLSAHTLPIVEVKILNDLTKAEDGMTKVAECRAIGEKSIPTVTWTSQEMRLKNIFNSTQASTISNQNIITVTSTLLLTNLEETAIYQFRFNCVITEEGSKEFISHSIVISTPTNPEITFNENLNQLTCSAEGVPPVKYTWILPQNEKEEGSTINVLITDDLDRQTDTYTCMVENVVGIRTANFTLGSENFAFKLFSMIWPIAGPGVLGVILGILVGEGYRMCCRSGKKTETKIYEKPKLGTRASKSFSSVYHSARKKVKQMRGLSKRFTKSRRKRITENPSRHKATVHREETENAVKMNELNLTAIEKKDEGQFAAIEKLKQLVGDNSSSTSGYVFIKHPEENFIGISGWGFSDDDENDENDEYV